MDADTLLTVASVVATVEVVEVLAVVAFGAGTGIGGLTEDVLVLPDECEISVCFEVAVDVTDVFVAEGF